MAVPATETMFRGSFEHTLDSKGRLSVPARFRDVLIGKGDDRKLVRVAKRSGVEIDG